MEQLFFLLLAVAGLNLVLGLGGLVEWLLEKLWPGCLDRLAEKLMR